MGFLAVRAGDVYVIVPARLSRGSLARTRIVRFGVIALHPARAVITIGGGRRTLVVKATGKRHGQAFVSSSRLALGKALTIRVETTSLVTGKRSTNQRPMPLVGHVSATLRAQLGLPLPGRG